MPAALDSIRNRLALSASLTTAAVAPSLLALNHPPSPTAYNQLLALALWGLTLLVLAIDLRRPVITSASGASSLAIALMLVAGLTVLSSAIGPLPWGMSGAATGLLGATLALVLSGAALRASTSLFGLFFVAWMAAGAASSAIAALQVFVPQWPDGNWIARSGMAGRAVGNLRQPNHLATLLLWSAVAIVPLVEMGSLGRTQTRRFRALGLMALMVLGVTLSGSRTGLVGIALLALWGLVDGRLSRFSRGLLLSTPLLCAASLGLTAWWAALNDAHAIGAAARIGEGDLSASRFAIWRDTIELIRMQPWLGVGFGEFNFAWSLTPLPNRPVAFFDHTHNLPLQLAVELGLPVAALVLGLLALALWQAWHRTWSVEGETGVGLRAAFVMVLLMALHSQLEYPLWYAHFLLPTALIWGMCLGAGAAREESIAPVRRGARWPLVAGLAMVIAAVVVVVDYRRVVVIFTPPASATPLDERIADGQQSWFFAHHADYAAATTAARPADAMAAFKRAPHHLLDTRLMIAWATALAQSGEVDKARYLAARLREFRNPAADEFFSACDDEAEASKPFQCEKPERAWTWRDFR